MEYFGAVAGESGIRYDTKMRGVNGLESAGAMKGVTSSQFAQRRMIVARILNEETSGGGERGGGGGGGGDEEGERRTGFSHPFRSLDITP